MGVDIARALFPLPGYGGELGEQSGPGGGSWRVQVSRAGPAAVLLPRQLEVGRQVAGVNGGEDEDAETALGVEADGPQGGG